MGGRGMAGAQGEGVVGDSQRGELSCGRAGRASGLGAGKIIGKQDWVEEEACKGGSTCTLMAAGRRVARACGGVEWRPRRCPCPVRPAV